MVVRCCSEAQTGASCRNSAELMTSEVVTNALLHGQGLVRLGVHAGTLIVRVEVGDDNPRHPQAPAVDDEAECGRGMLIVAALASAWGVEDDLDGGKTVWFEIAAQP